MSSILKNKHFLSHRAERLGAALWATGMSVVLNILFGVLAYGMLFSYGMLAGIVCFVSTTLFSALLGYFFAFRILTKNLSKKHYLYAAGIGYLSAIIAIIFVSVFTMTALIVGSPCHHLSHEACYGGSFGGFMMIYLASISVGLWATFWNVPVIAAIVCVLVRRRAFHLRYGRTNGINS